VDPRPRRTRRRSETTVTTSGKQPPVAIARAKCVDGPASARLLQNDHASRPHNVTTDASSSVAKSARCGFQFIVERDCEPYYRQDQHTNTSTIMQISTMIQLAPHCERPPCQHVSCTIGGRIRGRAPLQLLFSLVHSYNVHRQYAVELVFRAHNVRRPIPTLAAAAVRRASTIVISQMQSSSALCSLLQSLYIPLWVAAHAWSRPTHPAAGGLHVSCPSSLLCCTNAFSGYHG
jgi:hypothetical protein